MPAQKIPYIPITVFTGFLGAGKTSIILSLLPKLPKDYKVVLLKNEFGDIQVDSQLAKQSGLAAVSEILNGCLCCVLVGQMKNALLEIREKYRPDRIIIECSGSAFPATLAFQIRELERETIDDIKLDAIVTVIDAENFSGYEDTSPTAKMQASYSDIILINKWEHVDDRALDLVLDHLNTLNDLTPKIRCNGRDGVDPNLLFGVDTKLFQDSQRETGIFGQEIHHDEVQTVTLSKGSGISRVTGHLSHDGACNDCHPLDATGRGCEVSAIDEGLLRNALGSVSKETVWRIKGFVRLENGLYILNWAFGRYELTPYGKGEEPAEGYAIRLTVMARYFSLFAAAKDRQRALTSRAKKTFVHGRYARYSPPTTFTTSFGVPRSPDIDRLTLRRAYLSRSKACHPDKCPGNPDATHAFQKLSIAYGVLSQPSLKRVYDARPSDDLESDFLRSYPYSYGHADETLKGVLLSIVSDYLDGNLEMMRTLLQAISDLNPSLKLSDDGINSVLSVLENIRGRVLTCRACILTLHSELIRVLELQYAFRQLPYLDIAGRSRLTIQLTRITLSLPVTLEKAIQDAQEDVFADGRRSTTDGRNVRECDKAALLPKHVVLLIRGIDVILDRMERILG
ncbi:hypothetical protein J3R83DRAFT_12132 [Lanmaoa asiatica]|nr:hypothetical protein J3R83DRAFT_12132 [Lanmaoa asiatica]